MLSFTVDFTVSIMVLFIAEMIKSLSQQYELDNPSSNNELQEIWQYSVDAYS